MSVITKKLKATRGRVRFYGQRARGRYAVITEPGYVFKLGMHLRLMNNPSKILNYDFSVEECKRSQCPYCYK